MRKPIILAVAVLATFTTLKAAADTYIYEVGFWGNVTPVGRVSGGTDSAILCGGGQCIPIVNCNACHTAPPDQKRYAKDNTHQTIHFPKAALQLREGQQTTVGSILVKRLKGILEVQEPKGTRFRLPADAYVVTGKDGKPVFITYRGSTPPQSIK